MFLNDKGEIKSLYVYYFAEFSAKNTLVTNKVLRAIA